MSNGTNNLKASLASFGYSSQYGLNRKKIEYVDFEITEIVLLRSWGIVRIFLLEKGSRIREG